MMERSVQKNLKSSIIDFLQDGKEHSVADIKNAMEKKGITIEPRSSKLRTALYFLKQEDPRLINCEKGIYKYLVDNNDNNREYDLTGFEHINASSRESTKLVVSIMPNGTIALNGRLIKDIDPLEVEIQLKPDCMYLALIKNGNGMIKFGKNGRVKNYDLINKISKKRKKLPVYYVGEWDKRCQIWLGKLSEYNPNVGKNK